MIGPWSTILSACVTATMGALLLAAGLHGYLLRPASWWQRGALVAAAFCLIKPGWMTDLAGLALFGIVMAVQLLVPARPLSPGEQPVRQTSVERRERPAAVEEQ
jgi:TRAP-type uncharacterized transport system fused permease subunit